MATSVMVVAIQTTVGGAAGARAGTRAPLAGGTVVAVDMAQPAGIAETTDTWEGSAYDYNNDGCTDIVINRHSKLVPELYTNNCDGTFTKSTPFPKNDHHYQAWGDFNGDGLPDLYWAIGGQDGAGITGKELWIQQPDHSFVNKASQFGIADPYGRGRGVTALDVNKDGRVDLYTGNKTPRMDHIPDPNRLWINNGNGTFTDEPQMGVDYEEDTRTAATVDVNDDGWSDIFLQGERRSAIYLNNGGTSFTDVARTMQLPTGANVDAQLADLDGDGFPDLIWLTGNSIQIYLQRSGTFSDLVYSQTLKSPRAIATGDVNGDGALDIYVLESNNAKSSTDPDFVLLNDGTGTAYSQLAVPQATFGTGDAVWPIDYDNNGLTDFVVENGAFGGKAGPVELIAFFPQGSAPAQSSAAPPAASTPASGADVVEGDEDAAPPGTAQAAPGPSPASAGAPVLVSANSSGSPGNDDSIRASVSLDGRYVAFDSWADGLVAGEHNLRADVFVRDTQNGSTQVASVTPSGGAADLPSGAPRITPDGRFVVFYSYATNLVAGVGNGVAHIFVRDLSTGTTQVVDTASGGALADAESGSPAISDNGRYITFESRADNLLPNLSGHHNQVFVKDMTTGAVTLASANTSGREGNGDSIQPDISGDGTHVAFSSLASDLTPASDTNNGYDIFVRDLGAGTTVRVTVGPSGQQVNGKSLEPSISATGQFVAFTSSSKTLTSVVVPSSSPLNVFERDLSANTTVQVSVASDGTSADGRSLFPHVSSDGSSVVFDSTGSNITANDTDKRQDVFLRDVVHGTTTKVTTTASGGSLAANSDNTTASADNRFVVWSTNSTAIVPNPTISDQVYERDMQGSGGGPAATVKVSVNRTGGGANKSSNRSQVSSDGRWVVFSSTASNLVANDTNNNEDVFRRDLSTGVTARVSTSSAGAQGNGRSGNPSLDHSGNFVAFASNAENIIPNPITLPTTEPCGIYPSDVTPGEVVWKNISTGEVQRVDQATDGTPTDSAYNYSASISANGRYVAFISLSDNLVPNDTNCWRDIFLRDTQAGTTIRVSLANDGSQANGPSNQPQISPDGRYVVFRSYATNLVPGVTKSPHIYVRDVVAGTTTVADVDSSGVLANKGADEAPTISSGGRYVFFASVATNLVPNDTNGKEDVFVHDTQTGATTRVSLAPGGVEGNGTSHLPVIDDAGDVVAFESSATNLVPNDTNGVSDIFAVTVPTGAVTLVSVADDGGPADKSSQLPGISALGQYVVWKSAADNLVSGDTIDNAVDIFFRQIQ